MVNNLEVHMCAKLRNTCLILFSKNKISTLNNTLYILFFCVKTCIDINYMLLMQLETSLKKQNCFILSQ